MVEQPGETPDDADIVKFIHGLIEAGSQQRLPELFVKDHPDALYYLPDRNGVSTIVTRSPALSEEQLIKLMRYRLAQYLAVGFVDARQVYESRMEYEPLSHLSREDLHYIAGSAETGEILCYAVMKALPPTPPGTTLRTRDRPLFPVEKLHGWGIYNRLRVLPDLPIEKVREIGRFVKNQRLPKLDDLGARAPVEVGMALSRTLIGPLRMEVDAFVGGLEESVVKQNLDFFHVPIVIIHGTVPYATKEDFLYPRYPSRTVYAFAALVSDLSQAMASRWPLIERALEQPGKQGLLSLLELKRELPAVKSSFVPPEGLEPLTDATVPQQGVAMETRRQMLDVGDHLRQFDLFSGLSVAEAAILGSFMERVQVQSGDIIVRQAEPGDSLYLIELGEAEAQVTTKSGERIVMRTLGAGEYFGEIALLTGGERTADVIAITPMRLLKLTRETYTHYLSHIVEVEQKMARTAAQRATDTMRRIR